MADEIRDVLRQWIGIDISPTACRVMAKRLRDVFDDEINRIAQEVGSRVKAFKLVKHDKKLVRFFLPLEHD